MSLPQLTGRWLDPQLQTEDHSRLGRGLGKQDGSLRRVIRITVRNAARAPLAVRAKASAPTQAMSSRSGSGISAAELTGAVAEKSRHGLRFTASGISPAASRS